MCRSKGFNIGTKINQWDISMDWKGSGHDINYLHIPNSRAGIQSRAQWLIFSQVWLQLMHRAQSCWFLKNLKKFPIKTPGSIEKQNEGYSKSLKTHFAQKFWCLMKILFLPHTGHWGPKYISGKVSQNEFGHTMSKTTITESDMAQHSAGGHSFFLIWDVLFFKT